jgi:class 3 adenylate cyclase
VTSTIAVGTMLALVAILGGALYHQCRVNERLRAQLEATAVDLENLQQACSRLAPAGVVQQLVTHGAEPETGRAAEHKVVTAMFVDLVGYTAMSERLEPTALVQVLNGYYERMSDAIHEHRGQVGSFVGDGIVAYFGALQPNPWQCDDAVRAALAMRTAIREYNAELEREGLPRIAVGIGIDRGPGVAGLVGSRERRQYAFIGRAVNLAARLQALSRIHQVDILVTEAVRAQLNMDFAVAPMPAKPVKGLTKAVVAYAVVRERSVDREPAVG